MKKFFYLMSLCLCMFMGASVLTSCGDDDDDKIVINPGTLQEGVVEEGNIIKATAVEDGIAYVITAIFDADNKCTSFVQQYVFASVAAAQQAWAEFQKEEGIEEEKVAITGNVISWDRTKEFEGRSKNELSREIPMLLED